jgi:NAD(P)-dependent dehydrogenase (short-subunit alcohol dehydrogenase family)
LEREGAMPEGRFGDKVIVVTGGGSGIGKACALAFAREGGCVVIAGRREQPLKSAVEEIRGRGGGASSMTADISRSEEVRKLVRDTVKQFGKIDVFVANAAVHVMSTIVETTDDQVDMLVDINVKGTFYQCREAARQMITQGYGCIVAMSSMSGLIGHKNVSLYCSSKGAIVNLVHALSYELADKNIRVNAVCPGTIGKAGIAIQLAKASGDEKTWFDLEAKKVPMGRTGDPEEVAAVTLFLASDEASFVTGACYLVDGGMTVAR